jgi:hypothetical protein
MPGQLARPMFRAYFEKSGVSLQGVAGDGFETVRYNSLQAATGFDLILSR